MDSEIRSSRAAEWLSVCVGERVMLAQSDSEFIVVEVDHATGRLELLRLKPAPPEGMVAGNAAGEKKLESSESRSRREFNAED